MIRKEKKKKKQDKTTAKQLNEMMITDMCDKELKVMVITILTGFQKRVEDLSATLTKEKEKQIRNEELNNQN